ncbi:unnamed protein product [Mucor hiemalis]
MKIIETRHLKLTKKWKLRSGRYVEDIIYEEGKNYVFDHSFHSYIISLDDENVQKIITADEIEEVTVASGKSDLEAALPSYTKDLLQKLNTKSTYEEIESSYNNMCFSRRTHPEEN